ncbi:hypothetical protein EXIGLDRAFT_261524 [Exidia glandulosa HHB12029]|uniref:Uncharacterized protein n=1 Tax=Exidia glandulosa HHB12029 TaxID=1314781 RepID=A0A165DTI5_EXIGL|nr:hypothetical protein EXIGLDRAFT_261524 [Exidia glandulosa HHB12029]
MRFLIILRPLSFSYTMRSFIIVLTFFFISLSVVTASPLLDHAVNTDYDPSITHEFAKRGKCAGIDMRGGAGNPRAPDYYVELGRLGPEAQSSPAPSKPDRTCRFPHHSGMAGPVRIWRLFVHKGRSNPVRTCRVRDFAANDRFCPFLAGPASLLVPLPCTQQTQSISILSTLSNAGMR